MASFLSFLLGEKKKTASVAKERLQIILAHERNGRNAAEPDYLPALQAAAGGALLVRAARGSRYLTRDPDPRLSGAWDAHLADARELGLD